MQRLQGLWILGRGSSQKERLWLGFQLLHRLPCSLPQPALPDGGFKTNRADQGIKEKKPYKRGKQHSSVNPLRIASVLPCSAATGVFCILLVMALG